jgi:hypothetical protein
MHNFNRYSHCDTSGSAERNNARDHNDSSESHCLMLANDKTTLFVARAVAFMEPMLLCTSAEASVIMLRVEQLKSNSAHQSATSQSPIA